MNAGSASSARKKSDPSVSNVDSAEHAAAVVKALRSATSSQKRYQNTEGNAPVRPAELDNIIMRTRAEAERQTDARSRAESLLVGGSPAADAHRGDTYGSTAIKGVVKPNSVKPEQAAAGRISSSVITRPPAHPNSNKPKGGKKGRHNEDDIDFSSDDDVSALNRGTEMLVIEDEFTVKAIPVSSTTKASSLPTPPLQTNRIPVVKNINPLQRTPRGRTDAPSSSAVVTAPVAIAKKKTKGGRAEEDRFSSDDDDDVNKYMRLDDAPALPADDMLMAGSRGADDEGTALDASESSKPIAAGAHSKPSAATNLISAATSNKKPAAQVSVPSTVAQRNAAATSNLRSSSAGNSTAAGISASAVDVPISVIKKPSRAAYNTPDDDDDEFLRDDDEDEGYGVTSVPAGASAGRGFVKQPTSALPKPAVAKKPNAAASPAPSGGRVDGSSSNNNTRVIIKPGQAIKVLSRRGPAPK